MASFYIIRLKKWYLQVDENKLTTTATTTQFLLEIHVEKWERLSIQTQFYKIINKTLNVSQIIL